MRRALPLALLTCSLLAAPAEATKPGQKISPFKATDDAKQTHDTTLLKKKKRTLVVVVWSSRCLFSKQYTARLEALRKELTKKKLPVDFLVLAPSKFETPETIKKAKKKTKLTLPVVLDKKGVIAKSLKAVTSPTAYVIDQLGVLRFVGVIDDDPKGKKKPKKRAHYLRDAILAVVAGKKVKSERAPGKGFRIKY